MKPALKICGINDAAIAVQAARLGVDYLGFIFAGGSPRRVLPETARQIADSVRAAIPSHPPPRFVGVFTSHTAEEIAGIAAFAKLDVVQLHNRDYGAEEIKFLKSKGLEVWILHGLESKAENLCAADAVLLDGSDGMRSGGTGMRADWSLVAPLKASGRRVVLAGGISAGNVADAIATGADVIDVNSSLEEIKGVKSAKLVDEFFAKLKVQGLRSKV